MPLAEPIGYIVEDANANVILCGIVDHEHEIEHYFVDDMLFLDIATQGEDGIWFDREEVIHGIPGGKLRVKGKPPIAWQEGADHGA